MKTLKTIQLGSNSKIRGTLPKGLGRLTVLEHLAVSRNQMTGQLPEKLCTITSLRHIFMGFNELEGYLPSCIDQLVNLETLFVRQRRSANIAKDYVTKYLAHIRF